MSQIFENAWSIVKSKPEPWCKEWDEPCVPGESGCAECPDCESSLGNKREAVRQYIDRFKGGKDGWKKGGVKKADGAMTSGTPGTNNPRHGRDSPGAPSNFDRIKSRARKERKRRSMRPPGYGKDEILDPNRVKTPPRRGKSEDPEVDIESLLAENRKMTGSGGSMAAKSTGNLLYALGLIRKRDGICEFCESAPADYEENIWGVYEWCSGCEEDAMHNIYQDAARPYGGF